MDLFDKKFVYLEWDDVLEGKKVIAGDNLQLVRMYVNDGNGSLKRVKDNSSNSDLYPFKDDYGIIWTLVYYDPNYSCKLAYAQGKPIQCRNKGTSKWLVTGNPRWEDTHEYRVKPEDAYRVLFKKSARCMVYGPVDDTSLDSNNYYELFVGTDSECCKYMQKTVKFNLIMGAYYCDGKTIQSKCLDNNRWEDCKGEPVWFDECEYRVKPEMWTASIEENGIVHIMPAREWHKSYGRQLIEGTKEECKAYVIDSYHGAVCVEHVEQGQKKSVKRRMTNRELAQWVAQGNGQVKHRTSDYVCSAYNAYYMCDDNKPCPDYLIARGWDETEWHEPEVEE